MIHPPLIRGGSVMVDELFVGVETDLQARRVGTRHGHKWCHMWSEPGDDEDFLHAVAKAIGMKRDWFQDQDGSFPHYDLVPPKRELALKAGAIAVGLRDWLRERLRTAVTCPSCKGMKEHATLPPAPRMPCYFCGGRGRVPATMMQLLEAGKEARALRMAANLTVRDLANLRNVSPVRLSEMENGRRRVDPRFYTFRPPPPDLCPQTSSSPP